MFIVLGSVNSYNLKKGKAQLAKQSKIEKQMPQHVQQKSIRPDNKELEYDEEEYIEEEYDDEQEFTPRKVRRQAPNMEEGYQQVNDPKIPRARTSRVHQARETHYNNIENEIKGKKTNIPRNTYVNVNTNDNTISIPCIEPYKSDKLCNDKQDLIADATDSISKIFLGASNGETDVKTHLEADLTGSKMTMALADKICTEKGMRLPQIWELYMMFKTDKNDYNKTFSEDYYWAKPYGTNDLVYCFSKSEDCKVQEKINEQVQLHRARCVK